MNQPTNAKAKRAERERKRKERIQLLQELEAALENGADAETIELLRMRRADAPVKITNIPENVFTMFDYERLKNMYGYKDREVAAKMGITLADLIRAKAQAGYEITEKELEIAKCYVVRAIREKERFVIVFAETEEEAIRQAKHFYCREFASGKKLEVHRFYRGASLMNESRFVIERELRNILSERYKNPFDPRRWSEFFEEEKKYATT